MPTMVVKAVKEDFQVQDIWAEIWRVGWPDKGWREGAVPTS